MYGRVEIYYNLLPTCGVQITNLREGDQELVDGYGSSSNSTFLLTNPNRLTSDHPFGQSTRHPNSPDYAIQSPRLDWTITPSYCIDTEGGVLYAH